MVNETFDGPQPWSADGLVSELSIAANVIGIDQADLATALGGGLTIGQVALLHGVKVRRVITALVSDVVAGIADEIQRGDLSADQVRWLVALATWRAEVQVTSAFPAIEFRPGSLVPA
jgi:hypothetical protein